MCKKQNNFDQQGPIVDNRILYVLITYIQIQKENWLLKNYKNYVNKIKQASK